MSDQWKPVGFILEYDGFEPGDVGFILNVPGGEVTIKHLRAAAAAPDLLVAARRALNVFKAQGESVRKGSVLGALDEAIAKAEGRS